MVNTGLPSRACPECKARRVKCDLIRPSCSQCLKVGRRCSGAKSNRDIFIVDETVKVLQNADKARLSKARSSKSSESDSDLLSVISGASPDNDIPTYAHNSPSMTSEVSSFSSAASTYMMRLPQELRVSYEQPAIQWYYDTFVQAPSATQFLNQHLSSWSNLYGNASVESPARKAAYALSLAAFASRVNVREMDEYAKTLYGEALHTTALALANTRTRHTNETLFSVLLLSEYELCASLDTSSIGDQSSKLISYNSHIRGAVEIVLRRGMQDEYDETTVKLFRAVRLRVVLDGLDGAASSEQIPGVTDDAFYKYDAEDEPGNCLHSLYRISLALPTLRDRTTKAAHSADIAKRLSKPVDIASLEKLISDAQAVDTALQHWLTTLPASFRYCSISCLAAPPANPESIAVWPGLVHIYSNCFIASFLNNYRIMRIYLQELIAKCLAHLSPDDALASNSRQGQVLYTLRTMVDEICGTVPYLSGDEVAAVPSLLSNGSADKVSPSAIPVGSWLNLRPLYVASQVTCVPQLQKRWIHGRLLAIAREHGYKIARDIGREASPGPQVEMDVPQGGRQRMLELGTTNPGD